jgi:hypothetical protein
MVQFMYPHAPCQLLNCDVRGLTATATPEYRQGAYEEIKFVQKFGADKLPRLSIQM